MKSILAVSAVAALGAALAGCRGGISKQPPVHLVLDMDFQEKLKAQSASTFERWTDGRGMRPPVPGTVARGSLEDAALEVFQDAAGSFVDNRLPVSQEVLERGRERFDIYCAVCHDRAGSGKGMVLQRANPGAFNPIVPDLATEQRLIDMKDGELFQTLTNGKGTMPGYAHMIPPRDRWCIVHYVRALQYRMKN